MDINPRTATSHNATTDLGDPWFGDATGHTPPF